jgi:5,10-methylene-tetrahydrofolate dehydrogenase/methenyl tetrahydrofolate cyclohydrolase
MGLRFDVVRLPATCTQAALHAAVDRACASLAVDGVLVQLPLPPHLDEFAVMERLSPRKDVDGFHPLNMGRMRARGAPPRFVPATALGCMELLERYRLDVRVRRANLFLRPASSLLVPFAPLLRHTVVRPVWQWHLAVARARTPMATC